MDSMSPLTPSAPMPQAPIPTPPAAPAAPPAAPPPTGTTPGAPTLPTTPEYNSNPFRLVMHSLGQILTHNGFVALQLSALSLLIGFGGTLLAELIGGLLGRFSSILGVIVLVGLFLVIAYFQLMINAGMIKLFTSSAEGKADSWRNFLSQGRPYALRLVGLTIVMMFGLALGFLLLIIPGLILLSRWIMAPYVMVDQDLGVMAALGESNRLAKGHFAEILGGAVAGLLLSGYSLMSAFIAPAVLVGRYHEIRELKTSGAPKPRTHWMNWLLILGPLLVILVPLVLVFLLGSVLGLQRKANPNTPIQFNQQFDSSDSTN